MRRSAIIAIMTLAVSSGIIARDGEWRSLFDGKTTAGWRGYRQQGLPPGWQVVDGALTRVGQGGDIITTGEFESFELSLEWKVAPGSNSGVLFRVTEEADVIWHAAPEIQVIDNAYPQPLQPAQTAGSNYDLHAPALDAARSPGSWNQMRLIVKGNHVEHWLNGRKVVEYELGSTDWERRVKASKFKDYPAYGRTQKGHIGLQDHGDWVAYRNIKIRPL